jgi:hypothetical protein
MTDYIKNMRTSIKKIYFINTSILIFVIVNSCSGQNIHNDTLRIHVTIDSKNIGLEESSEVYLKYLDTELPLIHSNKYYYIERYKLDSIELCNLYLTIIYKKFNYIIQTYPFYFNGYEGKNDMAIDIDSGSKLKRRSIFKYTLTVSPMNAVGYAIQTKE